MARSNLATVESEDNSVNTDAAVAATDTGKTRKPRKPSVRKPLTVAVLMELVDSDGNAVSVPAGSKLRVVETHRDAASIAVKYFGKPFDGLYAMIEIPRGNDAAA